MNEYIQKCLDQLIEDNEFNSEPINNPKEKVKRYIEQLENFMMNGVISVLEAEKIVTETTEIIDDFLKGETK